ncbi:molybdopterin-dependent oxidoreductase [Actinacidiphila glaucinigra]|uniref:molybdopterin-dependent oxidoreductase n=1 Tax=Actinacidiphila glaucinigra TaxID=235986 RepID=UPI003723EC65
MTGVRISRTHQLTRTALGALSGLLAVGAALSAAELAAGALRPQAAPVVAVGGVTIDRTPAAVKDWAIRSFGTNDKLVLQLGILLVLGLLANGLGLLALRHRRAGAAGVFVFGVVGAVAALSRPDSAGVLDAVPSLVGALAGAALLWILTGRLKHLSSAAVSQSGGVRGRRRFLLVAASAAATSAAAGSLGRALGSSAGDQAVASRTAVRLPLPDSPARAVPRGAALRIAGISPFVTPNTAFYRVDTALVVPKVDATRWRLRVHGRGVSRPMDLGFQDLLRRELVERDITLTCVSNEVGGPYAGNARWLDVHLADLLREAGVRPPSQGGPADQLVSRSVDGMTIGTPVEQVMDGRDALLAVGMNGEPLPLQHGFPVRMVVPGLYGYVSACKWIADLELTTFAAYDPYWVQRKWARQAPIKTQSRIDTPKPFARPKAGTVMVAGVAWAQHRGVERVEVRVDDGPWRDADLAAQATTDTWRQWSLSWQATPGPHTLTVRATDGTGAVQTARRARTIPDGASGWHSVVITVD